MKGFILGIVLVAALLFAGCAPQAPIPSPNAQESDDGCGDGVCSAREANIGSCPADCKERQEEPAPEQEEESLACVGEGETVPLVPDAPVCCAGLEMIDRKESSILGIAGICTAKCGNGVCDVDTESPKNCADDCTEKLNSQPYCDGVGTSKEGWYQNDKLLFYNRCGGCVSECRKEGTPSEGWYNSCNDKQIKTGCGQ